MNLTNYLTRYIIIYVVVRRRIEKKHLLTIKKYDIWSIGLLLVSVFFYIRHSTGMLLQIKQIL